MLDNLNRGPRDGGIQSKQEYSVQPREKAPGGASCFLFSNSGQDSLGSHSGRRDIVGFDRRRGHNDRVQLLHQFRVNRCVVHVGVLAIIPEADDQRLISIEKGQLILESGLLPQHRQNLRIEQLDKLVPLSIL